MKNENSIDLPMEIWQKIFRFLDKKCRKNATLTCRKWFKIIRHDTIQSGMDLFISGQNTLKRSSTNYRLQFIKVIHFFIKVDSKFDTQKTTQKILMQFPKKFVYVCKFTSNLRLFLSFYDLFLLLSLNVRYHKTKLPPGFLKFVS